LVEEERNSRCVLLEGYSGNGKSTLVSHFGNAVQNETIASTAKTASPCNKTRFIQGKFDEQHPKPFSAFAQAFQDLCSYLIRNRNRPEEADRIEAIVSF